ncbi:hypothetical protein AB1E18_018439 [Capra hircus]
MLQNSKPRGSWRAQLPGTRAPAAPADAPSTARRARTARGTRLLPGRPPCARSVQPCAPRPFRNPPSAPVSTEINADAKEALVLKLRKQLFNKLLNHRRLKRRSDLRDYASQLLKLADAETEARKKEASPASDNTGCFSHTAHAGLAGGLPHLTQEVSDVPFQLQKPPSITVRLTWFDISSTSPNLYLDVLVGTSFIPGFSGCEHGPQGTQASAAAALRPQSSGSGAVVHGLRCSAAVGSSQTTDRIRSSPTECVPCTGG